jgi:hypothetical protein
MSLWDPLKTGNFLTNWKTIHSSRRNRLSEIGWIEIESDFVVRIYTTEQTIVFT